MLHEILIALLGESGGIIYESNGIFLVREDCDLLTRSEKELINRILRVAGFYKYLENFSQKYGSLNLGIQEEDEINGLYLKSLCKGIKDLLEEYRFRVAAIEQEYLEERAISFPCLLERINSEELEGVVRVVKQVENRKLRGGQLLDLLTGEERCPYMKSIMQRVHSKVLQVFFHQLIAWSVHGNLLDTYHEFFITEQEGDEWTSKFVLDLDMLPESCIGASQAEKVLFIGKAVRVLGNSIKTEEILEFATALREVQNNFSKLLLSQVLERIRKLVNKKLWNLVANKSSLHSHILALKNYFLLARGEFILTFLQESADLLALGPSSTSIENDLNIGPFAQAQSSLEEDPYLSKFRIKLKQSGFECKDFTKVADFSMLGSSRRFNNVVKLGPGRKIGTIWHNRKHPVLPGFSSGFTVKGSPPLNLSFIIQSEKDISGQYVSGATHLDNIENGLAVHFHLNAGVLKVTATVNKKVFLEIEEKMEKTLFDFLINVNNDLLSIEVNKSSLVDKCIPIHLIKLDLGSSAFVGLGSSSSIELQKWFFKHVGVGINTGAQDQWSGLTLEYSAEQPINLMLSNQILDKYMTLFSFLFSLRRAQFVLNRAWLKKMKSPIANREFNNSHSRKGLHLLSQMNFFLENFISYLQVDVIEAHFSQLRKQLDNSEDFEEIRKFHEQYVAGIANQCFLQAPKVVKEVQGIADNCHRLASILESGGDLLRLENEFLAHSKEVFEILSSHKSQHPALGQLLLRLDFNEFYSGFKNQMGMN
jgi:gamma-tubulin complex component 4